MGNVLVIELFSVIWEVDMGKAGRLFEVLGKANECHVDSLSSRVLTSRHWVSMPRLTNNESCKGM